MITRDKAKKLVDEKIFSMLLATALESNTKGFSETDALCYGFSALIMSRAFPKANHTDNSFEIAVAAQCTTLACAIDAGALSKQYIYNSYVNLMQETTKEGDIDFEDID